MENEKYRNGLKRIWAAIVDVIVFLPLLLVEQWIFRTTQSATLILSWLILTAFLPIIYSIILHYKYGQTIGKWVVGVRLIDINGTRKISFKQSVLRDILYLTVEVIGLFYFLFLMSQASDPKYLFNDYNNFSEAPLFIWTLLELISMLTNSKRRALHDFLAKTVVVRT
jgi:uncharacterized RDD family membrane protein YckC